MLVGLCVSQTVPLFNEHFLEQKATTECDGFQAFRGLSLFPETSENLHKPDAAACPGNF